MEQNIILFPSYDSIKDRIEILSFQRNINKNVVENIKNHILNYRLQNLTPILSVIDIGSYQGKYYIIDGQHRLLAIKELFDSQIIISFNCLIYNCQNYNDMKEIFILRNSGLEVPNYILFPPTNKESLLIEIKDYIRLLMTIKKEKIFRELSSKNKRINRPYIDINIFMNFISNSEFLIDIHKIEDFIIKFNLVNEHIKKVCCLKGDFKTIHNPSDSMIRECTETLNGIFIGLLKNYNIFEEIFK